MKEIVRVGLSGLGRYSVAIANAVAKSKKVKLVACYSPTQERRTAAAEKFGCAAAASYEDMVKRDDVDAVLLVSPNAVHRAQAQFAAAHGKHVFVEKPIANTIEDGRSMIAACTAAGVVLLVGQLQRRFAANRKVKELMTSGAIGKPVMVEANNSSGQGFTLTPADFRWRDDDSGCPAGPLMTMGVHQADTFNYLFGPVKTVFSLFKKLYISAPVPDVTATVLEFESGLLGYLGSSYVSPRTNWMRVYGTDANVFHTLTGADPRFDAERKPSTDQSVRLEIFEKGKDGPQEIPLPTSDPVLEEIDEFADCILTGRPPETDGPAALKALALIRAAIESQRTGRPVDVNTVL